MTTPADIVRLTALRATLATLSDFHSQPSLRLLETQLSSTRITLRPALWALAVFRRSRMGILLILLFGLLTTRRRWFSNVQKPFYVVSLTPNNDRVLDQLGDVLRSAKLPFMINRGALSWVDRLACLKDSFLLADLLKTHGDNRSFVFLHQVIGALYILLFDADLSVSQPQIVIAANDHSPPTVALFALARARNLKSCYVQHGPVTPSFPPLSTDFALLFCAKAQDDYQAAARARQVHSETDVLIFPAVMDSCLPIKTPTAPLRICIALSFFTDTNEITQLVAQLRTQATVGDIVISQHPRSTQDLMIPTDDNQTRLLPIPTAAKDIVNDVDICLVGNSGVALEFLHYGCPTFYLTPSEPPLDDYYGFVQAGILPRFDLRRLTVPTQMATFFDTSWRTAMIQVDPTFETSPPALHKVVVDHFESLLETKLTG